MLRMLALRLLSIAVLFSASHTLAADPQEAAPESLRKYFVTLADIVHAAGLNRIDQAMERAAIDANPAFRNPDDRAKFKDGLHKLLGQIGKIRPKFESYDVVAITPISSQAFSVHGVGNGERGPMHIDFDVYFYDGRWHFQGVHYHAGFKRDREIPNRAIYFAKPFVLRLDQAEMAMTPVTAVAKQG